MRKTILGGALAAMLAAAPAYATTITVTGYDLPDAQAFYAGRIDGYSYYDGPVTLHIAGGPGIIAYCADLNHILHAQDYHYSYLTTNGRGDPIDAQTSHFIGYLAHIGVAYLNSGTIDGDRMAAAAQLAIWSTEYGDPVTDIADPVIEKYFSQLMVRPKFVQPDAWAIALVPGGDWPADGGLSQQMVLGVLTAPEPSTWAMGLMGFGFAGLLGLWKTRRAAQKMSVA